MCRLLTILMVLGILAGFPLSAGAEPVALDLVSFFDTPSATYSIVSDGDYAYAVRYGDGCSPGFEPGLLILDISNPSAPAQVAFEPTPGCPGRLAVDATHLYARLHDAPCVPADGGDLAIYDVSTPASPGLIYLDDHGVDMLVTDPESPGLLYATRYAAQDLLMTIDVSDPEAPTVLDSLTIPNGLYLVVIAYPYAYLAGPDYTPGPVAPGNSVLQVIDVSDPAALEHLSTTTFEDFRSASIAVAGSWLYVLGQDEALYVLDVSDPANPTPVSFCETAGGSLGVQVHHGYLQLGHDYALVSLNCDGLWVVDILDAYNPAVAAYYESAPAWIGSTALVDTYLCASGEGGVSVLRAIPLFDDMRWGDWGVAAVHACADAGIVAGYGERTYAPSIPVTRDQMAVYVSRALAGGDGNVPAPGGDPTFSDVPEGRWGYRHIEYAVAAGVVQGYPGGMYLPELPVTRDQMAVYVARAVVDPTGEDGLASYIPPAEANFSDVPEGSWAFSHVEYCAEHGIVQGYLDGTYQPGAVVTRDQMAVYIARAFGLQ